MGSIPIDEAITWLEQNPSADNIPPLAWQRLESARYRLAYPERSSLFPGTPGYEEAQYQLDDTLEAVAEAKKEQEFRESGIDTSFANPVCDCAPGEPCCLRAFEVKDAKDPSRKITWPPPAGTPTTLYVIAKDQVNGSPSGQVTLALTDKDTCKSGTPNRPCMLHSEFEESGYDATPVQSATVTAIAPLQIPAAMSTIFPQEVATAIYIAGYYLFYSAYERDDRAKVEPCMCLMDNFGRNIEVHPAPYVDLSGKVSGTVSATFYFDKFPTTTAMLAGNIQGTVGYQTIQYTGSQSTSVGANTPSRSGPVKNPVMGVISKMYDRMSWMSSEDAKNKAGAAQRGIHEPAQSNLSISLETGLEIGKMTLQAKPGAPSLQLSCKPLRIFLTPSVTGTVDVLDMMISRVPKLADAVREARAALADRSRPVSMTLKGEIVLSVEGTVSFATEKTIDGLAIGGDANWKDAFGNIGVVFQSDAKIIGKLEVAASVGVNTWFFDGGVEANLTASTGWHFGGRLTNDESGNKKTETLYYFEGIRLQGSYAVKLGEVDNDKSAESFDTGSDLMSGTATTSTKIDNRATLYSGSFDVSLYQSEGGPDAWTSS